MAVGKWLIGLTLIFGVAFVGCGDKGKSDERAGDTKSESKSDGDKGDAKSETNDTKTEATGETSTEQAETVIEGNPRVVMKTSLGTIVLELYADKAPITVQNFLQYVESGHFEGTIFHRAIPTFMIQGGGFVSPVEKKDGNKPPIENEAGNGLTNDRGTIAMARTDLPHSATTEFFINVKDNDNLNHRAKQGSLWGYCVFGQVVEGMDVVDEIKNLPTKPNPVMRNEKSLPTDPPVIEKVTIEK